MEIGYNESRNRAFARSAGVDLPALMRQILNLLRRRYKMDSNTMSIEQARKRLEAAKLRVQAASRSEAISAYYRQAARPAYDGQAGICLDKAAMWEALRAKDLAQADLLDAEAGNE